MRLYSCKQAAGLTTPFIKLLENIDHTRTTGYRSADAVQKWADPTDLIGIQGVT